MIKRIDTVRCDGCSVCVEVCPMDVLRIDEIMEKAVIRYFEDCMTCFNCERACPRDCIDVGPFHLPVQAIIPNRGGETS